MNQKPKRRKRPTLAWMDKAIVLFCEIRDYAEGASYCPFCGMWRHRNPMHDPECKIEEIQHLLRRLK